MKKTMLGCLWPFSLAPPPLKALYNVAALTFEFQMNYKEIRGQTMFSKK